MNNNFINKLDSMIREYEHYTTEFPELSLTFRMITAELKVLRNEYFSELNYK
jgi:hypothetical protein